MIIELDDTLAAQCALTPADARVLLALALHRVRGVPVAQAGAVVGIGAHELEMRCPPLMPPPDFGVDDIICDLQLQARG